MILDLNSREARLVLEALHALESEWSAAIDATTDEELQSEYGNDLARLHLVHERIASVACTEFGPGVRHFSREPIGATPKH